MPAPLSARSTSSTASSSRRRLPIGAEARGDRTHFRVWAPAAQQVEVVLHDRDAIGLVAEAGGYFSGEASAPPGTRYRYRLDGGQAYPDPASRFQPEGPHGPSEVVDAAVFEWSDERWRGLSIEGQVVYELHVGTFTREGTWAAAERELPELATAGITVIELMPIADFAGAFGWGYDGVNLFAPTHLYGRPDDLRRFVDRAHAARLGVILDVVYNHFGPVGNYLRAFSPAYFTDRYENEWGDAINFDGADAAPVREFFVSNAGYWIDEFHLDGLRLDATQQIFDASAENVMAVIGTRVRDAANGRSTIVVAENEPQDTRIVRPASDGGYGLDGLWNDDFHHSAVVALTGHAEAYYSDTRGNPQEFISAAKYGYLFQGQQYAWQRQPRGTPAWGIPPAHFVAYVENHDQVANSARGLRVHQLTSPGRWRAMTALLLLGPWTPMLFQGQEFAATTPFLYFADFDEELNAAVQRGRAEFLLQFPSVTDYQQRATLDKPSDPATFERCKLDFTERAKHAGAYALHRDLLQIRRDDEAFRVRRPGGVDGAVLSSSAFLLRYFADGHEGDRLLIVNLGVDLCQKSFAEPLIAPPPNTDWVLRWSSEDPKYGGGGAADPRPRNEWMLSGESALVFAAQPCTTRSGQRIKRRTA